MEPTVIPPIANEPQFAVAWLSNGTVVIIGPEDYCRRYCGRANEDETRAFYHVIPYTGPAFRTPRHQSSSFFRPIASKLDIGITVETPSENAKMKVKEYLKKIA